MRFKFYLLTATLVVLACFESNAQLNNAIGVTFSPNLATASSSTDVNEYIKSKPAFSGAIQYRRNILKEYINITTGISYTNKGFNNDLTFSGQNNLDSVVNIQQNDFFIGIPIDLNFNFHGFYLGAGPEFNFLTSHEYLVDEAVVASAIDSTVQEFHTSMVVKVGYNFKLGEKTELGVSGFYNYALNVVYLNYGLNFALRYCF